MVDISQKGQDDRSYEALIERILQSRHFENTTDQVDLLWFLFKVRSVPVEARDIEIQHFKIPQGSDRYNPSHARNRIKELRERLVAYADGSRGERWRCEIETISGSGYSPVCEG